MFFPSYSSNPPVFSSSFLSHPEPSSNFLIIFRCPPPITPNNPSGASLLTLPAEVRLEIYSYLLPQVGTPISVRSANPALSPSILATNPGRHTYIVKTGSFKIHSTRTTWHLAPSNFKSDTDLGDTLSTLTALLLTHPLLSAEVHELLYSQFAFDFANDLSALIPFLSALPPSARHAIRRLRLVKAHLPIEGDFERCEWRAACHYIGSELDVSKLRLELGVEAAKPFTALREHQAGGWSKMWELAKGWEEIMGQSGWWEGDKQKMGIEWVEATVEEICGADGVTAEGKERKLRSLEVKAVWEAVSLPRYLPMAWFVGFSGNIEGSFGSWLKERMVGKM